MKNQNSDISKRVSDKLARIVELMGERDRIDSELGELLGISAMAERESDGVPRKYRLKKFKEKGERKPTTCKGCGGTGHTRKTCGRQDGPKKEEESDDGTPGTWVPIAPPKSDEALTLGEYEDANESNGHGMSAKEIADAMGKSIRHINKALQAPTYKHYLNSL